MKAKRFFTLGGFMLYFSVSAQITHTAVRGDNMYSIAKGYGITVNELFKLNPKFEEEKNLKVGDVLVVSEKKASKFGNVTLRGSQRVADIVKQYNISEKDLRLLNPDLDSQLKSGGKLVLPHENIVEYEVTMQKSWEKSMTKMKKNAAKDSKQMKQKEYQSQLAKIIINRNHIIKNIAKNYNISENELRELNPDLESKLKVEGEITLPLENIKNMR